MAIFEPQIAISEKEKIALDKYRLIRDRLDHLKDECFNKENEIAKIKHEMDLLVSIKLDLDLALDDIQKEKYKDVKSLIGDYVPVSTKVNDD
jgi:hypothetical protein